MLSLIRQGASILELVQLKFKIKQLKTRNIRTILYSTYIYCYTGLPAFTRSPNEINVDSQLELLHKFIIPDSKYEFLQLIIVAFKRKKIIREFF